ncbi:MAG TPA: hypothetical protein VFG46_22285, partial [Chryseolinea sp.]|nr:hypothetical protein [Chryseolinea sp.]
LRKQLAYLKNFLNGFDFLKMQPDSTIIASNFALYKKSQVLAEAGRQYGVYIFGKGPFNLELSIPAGTYRVEFMDPLTGKNEQSQNATSNGKVTIVSPAYAEDVAIKLVAADN